MNVKFNPVQCTSARFNEIKSAIKSGTSFPEGFLYFLTDTKQMFLGKNGEFIEYGGGISVIYGNKTIDYVNNGIEPDPNVEFRISDLEDSTTIPRINDLILNKDGCFYRIRTIGQDKIQTTRVTLRGSGSVSGGGGSPAGNSWSITNVGHEACVFSSQSEKMILPFTTYYNGTDDNKIVKIRVEYGGSGEDAGKLIFEQPVTFPLNATVQEVDLIRYKDLFSAYETEIVLWVYDQYGIKQEARYRVSITELTIDKSDTATSYIFDTDTFKCYITGGTQGVSNKQINYCFYDYDQPDLQIGEEKSYSLSTNKVGNVSFPIESDLAHGVYIIKAWVSVVSDSTLATIPSNVITFIYCKKVQNTPLLAVLMPQTAEAYTDIPIEFMIASFPSDNNKYTISIEADGQTRILNNISPNVVNKDEKLYFENEQIYQVRFRVEGSSLSYTTDIKIVKYMGNLPTIDNTNDLMIYLNPKGYSNNREDRNKWKDYYGSYVGMISNQVYSNTTGWQTDDTGSYLQLTSGGSLVVDTFTPFAQDPSAHDGMTIELDFEISGVTDYNKPLLSCISSEDLIGQKYSTGFVLYGNEICLHSFSNKLLSTAILESKRIRITYVIEPKTTKDPMCYCYLNGKVIGIVNYLPGTDSFGDNLYPAKIMADSTYGQIKIYGIRFYNTRHAESEILNNYIASLQSVAQRKELSESVKVYNEANNKIDYKLVSSPDYNSTIPYMTLTGGYKTIETSKWQLEYADQIGTPGLPTDKKDYRMVDVEVVYPDTPQFAGYEKKYSFKNTFDNNGWITDNYGNKPNNGGCIMYAQGTSSMEYPVKNLRLRWKKEEDFFTVKPDLEPVEIICMKADYMESSGSHNTGGGNLMDDLYKRINLKTPAQEYFSDDNIVTAIKGYPCLIFYRPDENTEYEYIGKYNLNLDKATPKPFGFKHDDDFGYLQEGDPYYKVTYYDEKDPTVIPFIGQSNPDEGGDYYPEQDEELATVGPEEKINSIHCFEFLDNAVEVCNFLKKVKAVDEDQNPTDWYSFYDTWYGKFKNNKGEEVPGWALGFESRYPEDRLGYHDADMLYDFASWLHNLYTLYTEEIAEGKSPTEKEEQFAYNPAPSQYDPSITYYEKDTGTGNFIEVYLHESEFVQNKDKYFVRTTVSSRFVMTSLERFAQEYQCYLNKEFLLFYYIMTEALLMVDSRTKNMMIATWGREQRTYKDIISGENKTSNYYIWYPIFYDMDTMMGLDNTGVQQFEYYDTDDNSDVYNGDEVLWTFVKYTLTKDLANMYNSLENTLLNNNKDDFGNYTGVLPYFNERQANIANEAFYNSDAQYKYIRPAKEDYISPDGTSAEAYLYAAQGDRSLDRELFFTNRIKYLRGKYNTEDFRKEDRVVFRWGYLKGNLSPEQELSKLHVAPSGRFEFESLQPAYVGVQLGANGNVLIEKFDKAEQKELNYLGAAQAHATEAYILGVSNLKSFGDLSTKYMQKFVMPATENKISELILGNPNKHYYNTYWNDGNSEITLTGCKYLQKFQLYNCSFFSKTLDFSTCPNIETILLTGSSVSGLTLPVGGTVSELRLPPSVRVLRINTHPLTDDKFSIGTYQYGEGLRIGECPEGSDIPYGYYENDYSSLQKLEIINTPIDTYKILKTSPLSLTSYCLQGFSWTIIDNDFLYCTPEESFANRVSDKIYYIREANEMKAYLGSEITNDTMWRGAKEKRYLINNGVISTIPVLDYLAGKSASYNDMLLSKAEALIGTIKIDISATADKYELYKKYKNLYPNVKIEYSSAVSGLNPYEIIFYNVLDPSNIDEGVTVPYYSTMVPANNTSTLNNYLEDLISPSNVETNTHIYTFTGTWLDLNTGNPIDFNTYVPNNNLILIPQFTTQEKNYYVRFYKSDKEDPYATIPYHYGDTIGSNSDAPLYITSPNEDYKDLTKRYTFKGWIRYDDYINKVSNPQVYNLDTKTVTSDLYLYPWFIQESTEVGMDKKYFTVSQETATLGTDSLTNQWIIDIDPKYRQWLSGKITLPAKIDGHTIDFARDFSYMENIISVQFEKNSSYKGITGMLKGGTGSYTGFRGCSNLTTVILPDTMEYIGYYSFESLSELTNIQLSKQMKFIYDRAFTGDLKLTLTGNALPNTIEKLGISAFSGCNALILTSLPDSIKTLSKGVFAYCGNVTITEFGYVKNATEQSATSNGLEEIGEGALRGINQTIPGTEMTIVLNDSIKTLGKGCFANIGNNKLTKIFVDDNTQILSSDAIISQCFEDCAQKVEII